jgi:hypothetical protein
MNDNKDIKLPFLSRDADAKVDAPDLVVASATAETPAVNGGANDYLFQCFPDGSLFRYGAHPDGSGRQCLLDSRGTVVGVVAHKAIADFLVRGAHCLCCILRDEAKGIEPEVGGK